MAVSGAALGPAAVNGAPPTRAAVNSATRAAVIGAAAVVIRVPPRAAVIRATVMVTTADCVPPAIRRNRAAREHFRTAALTRARLRELQSVAVNRGPVLHGRWGGAV